ncbi:MAG: hypothetical protein HYZ34_09435 [Ignavibacteriae bacterium]|nr:hypothetical protein [Ignavibacteriota bacterium]
MKFSKEQHEALYEITKEAGAVVLGGLVIAGVWVEKVNPFIVALGLIIYLVLVISAVRFKNKTKD